MCCGTACAGSPSSQPLPEQIRLPAVIRVDDPRPDLTGDDAHAVGGASAPSLAGDGAAGFQTDTEPKLASIGGRCSPMGE